MKIFGPKQCTCRSQFSTITFLLRILNLILVRFQPEIHYSLSRFTFSKHVKVATFSEKKFLIEITTTGGFRND